MVTVVLLKNEIKYQHPEKYYTTFGNIYIIYIFYNKWNLPDTLI